MHAGWKAVKGFRIIPTPVKWSKINWQRHMCSVQLHLAVKVARVLTRGENTCFCGPLLAPELRWASSRGRRKPVFVWKSSNADGRKSSNADALHWRFLFAYKSFQPVLCSPKTGGCCERLLYYTIILNLRWCTNCKYYANEMLSAAQLPTKRKITWFIWFLEVALGCRASAIIYNNKKLEFMAIINA